MTTDTAHRIDAADLDVVAELGSGGQGRVSLVRPRTGGDGGPVAFKEYLADRVPLIDEVALHGLVDYFHSADDAGRDWLGRHAAWPTHVVVRDGAVCGFLMQLAPADFSINLRQRSGGHRTQLMAVEYLLNPPEYMAKLNIQLSDRDRLDLLRRLATILQRLHAEGIVVGDLSPKNVLVTLVPQPQCFLIDCDAVSRNGQTVLDQAETPDWEIPAGEPLATVGSDVYKLGLLGLRLLVGDQSTRDLGLVPDRFDELTAIIRRSLAHAPQERPGITEWIATLDRMIPLASTARSAAPPAAASPAPAAPAPPTPVSPVPVVPPPITTPAVRPRKLAALPTVFAVLAAIVVIAICGVVVSQGNDQRGDASTSGAVNTPGFDAGAGPPAGAESPAGREPTAGQQTTPPVTTVGSVDIAAVAGDERAPALGQLFDTYFTGINAKAYDRVLALYDPSGVIDPNNERERNAFIKGVSTSQDDNVRLLAISSDGVAVLARVSFRSTQASGAGPATNPNETCTQWDVTYRLSQNAGEYRILGSTAQHQPC